MAALRGGDQLNMRRLFLLAMALVAGCAYQPGRDSTFERSLSWFSYMGAEDIRRNCRPGAPDRLRLVYNGDYDQQVRSYDVAVARPDGAIMEVRVKRATNIIRGVEKGDPREAWRAATDIVRLDAGGLDALKQSLRESGYLSPGPEGLQLLSNEFYWVVSGCWDGRFVLNAWAFPSPRFKALRFSAFLLRHDPTGVPVAQPHPSEQWPPRSYERFLDDSFEFRLGPNRLIGAKAAFGG